jgi:hypothetical protein
MAVVDAPPERAVRAHTALNASRTVVAPSDTEIGTAAPGVSSSVTPSLENAHGPSAVCSVASAPEIV